MIWYVPFCEKTEGRHEAPAEYVDRLVVVWSIKVPLARITVIGVIPAAGPHNEWSVSMAGESINKDSFIPQSTSRAVIWDFGPSWETECVSLMEACGKSRGPSERDLISSSDGWFLVGIYGKGGNAPLGIVRLPLGEDAFDHG